MITVCTYSDTIFEIYRCLTCIGPQDQKFKCVITGFLNLGLRLKKSYIADGVIQINRMMNSSCCPKCKAKLIAIPYN